MSKTTILLLIILVLFLGLLLYIVYEPKQNPLITSLTPATTQQASTDATLSLTTTTQTVQRGQTIILAVVLNNATPHPNLAQFELAYDPQMIEVTEITPGSFFTNPTVALQKIDSLTGRLTYALRCATEDDCTNAASATLATLTIRINPYAVQNSTTISFLQKTVLRTHTNSDILKKTNGLQLTLNKPLLPIASSSAIASPEAK